MTFTEKELYEIDCALCVAAAVYRDDAKNMRAEGQIRVAEQLERQEKIVRGLMDRIGSR